MLYTKMHGLGNDFILCYDFDNQIINPNKLAISLCNRNTGVGGDGLIIAKKSNIADIRMMIINSDGTETEMCGNGTRCFAHYVYKNRLIKNKTFSIETLSGIIKPTILEYKSNVSTVKVNMGKPIFLSSKIPIKLSSSIVLDYKLLIENCEFNIAAVLMGVPHVVIRVNDLDNFPVTKWGPLIEKHPIFPNGTNVNFVEILDSNTIKVRTWERGAGQTLACGTGCCSSVVLNYKKGILKNKAKVIVPLGCLNIEYTESIDGNVYMTGKAEEVFQFNL